MSGAASTGAAELAPGEIVLRDATRWFSVRADQAGTLKGFLIGRGTRGPAPVPALHGVTLRVAPGETVGMVGRNGAGKTSTLRVLAGIIPLQEGEAACGGRTVALLELAAGFSRDFSGRENVYLQGALYGLTKPELDERIEPIVAFSELGEFIDAPVKTYSSGMLLRLGFSIAAHLDAHVLLIDEVLAVGDEAFQRKCLRRISEQIAAGATVVLVSHDPGAIERVCERVVVLDGGRLVFDGATAEGLLHYHRLMGTERGGGESVRPPAKRSIDVTDVELRDELGRASGVFRTGQTMQVHVGLRARHPLQRGSLRLELRAGRGERLFRADTPIELPADGVARMVFEIPDLALLGGDYDLALGAAGDAEEPGPDRTVRFSVARSDGPEGIVDLRGGWRSLEPVESLEPAEEPLVTTPERALDEAREAAAQMRAHGAYGEGGEFAPLDRSEPLTAGKLFEWALIDPDLRNVRSTRRLGAPITALKRGLLRLLAQYHAELIAEQARFNVNVTLYVRRLEERVAELEHELGRGPEPPAQ